MNRERVKCLSWVSTMVIKNFIPFDFLQQPEVRTSMSVMGNGNLESIVPFAMLNPLRIRHYIIEIYAAVKSLICGSIDRHVVSKPIPFASFTVDKVKSKVSGENFLGLRVYFLDSSGDFKSYNLSIKQFRPSSNLSKDQASVVLRTWLDYSLREFGLDRDNHIGKILNCSKIEVEVTDKTNHSLYSIANSVTDAGPEVRRCCDVLLQSPWGWCTSHMLSTAFAAAFDSVNRLDDVMDIGALKDLLRKVRKIVEYFHKSSEGATLL